MENCTGLKPILDDVDLDEPDILRAIARKYYHLPCSVMTPNARRFETLRSLAAKFRPHCVIELVWQACLTYDIESFQVRKLVEEELQLPYLKITTDYSPSDSARISARVEALFETIRAQAILVKSAPQIHLSDVQAVYSGPEGRLWELLMGEQIHIGGFQSSMDLAQRAGIAAGSQGVDLCCCTGAGMRFLARFCNVAHMTGVDATPADAATRSTPRRPTKGWRRKFRSSKTMPAPPACRPAGLILCGVKMRGATLRTSRS